MNEKELNEKKNDYFITSLRVKKALNSFTCLLV